MQSLFKNTTTITTTTTTIISNTTSTTNFLLLLLLLLLLPAILIFYYYYYYYYHYYSHYYNYYYYYYCKNLGGHVNAICDRQSGTGTGFCLCASVFPAAVIPLSLRTPLFISGPRHVVLVIDSLAK